MSSGIPRSPEADRPQPDDLPSRILGKVAERLLDDPSPHLSRSQLSDQLIFDDTLNQQERWELVAEHEKVIAAALFDERLAHVVTQPEAPRVVAWQGPHGPTEATLVRCNESFSVAYEVTVGPQGNPMRAVTALWQGDERAVEDFLGDHRVAAEDEQPGEHPELEEEAARLERLEQLIESLPPGGNRTLARLALLTVAAGVMVSTSRLAGLSRLEAGLGNAYGSAGRPNGSRPMPVRPSKGRRTDLSRLPGSNTGVFAGGPRHTTPIRQPKPQSGAKWGKRA